MPFVVRLLIVEDTDTEITTWKSEIEIHNAADNPSFLIEATYSKSLPATKRLLEAQDFHAAIVDINLEQENMAAANSDGNQVIERLLNSELAVVAVFTGEQPLVEIPDWASRTVRIFRKGADEGEGTQTVMDWLSEQIPLLRAIKQAQSVINAEMVQLFNRSIWPRWSHWSDKNDPSIETALSRHLASHIHASLLEDDKHKAHPEEWYFVPPIREGIRTGDLIRIGNDFEVVITPRCDLATDKIDTLQLAECLPVSDQWRQLCDALEAAKNALAANNEAGKAEGLQKKVHRAEENLRKFTQHDGAKASVHFLPSIRLDGAELGPFMVRFNKIRTINKKVEELKDGDKTQDQDSLEAVKAVRIAALTPEFLPSLVERLGSYYSRIGTPNYSHPG